jgi:hypothetical protein
MSGELDGAYALIIQLREKESRMRELERTHPADLQERLYHSQQELIKYFVERQQALQYETREFARGSSRDPHGGLRA